MNIKSQRDFWAGLMFLVVGAGFAIGATNYSMGTSARPGAGYFPLGLGVLTALLGAFILFESLTIETDDGEPVGHIAWRPLIVIFLTINGVRLVVAAPGNDSGDSDPDRHDEPGGEANSAGAACSSAPSILTAFA